MAFNPHWRPLCKCVDIRCDYPHLPFRIRQKMPLLQSFVLETVQMSHIDYRLVLLDDGCAIADPIHNKFLCYYDYNSPLILLTNRLEELWQFYRYETSIYKPKNNLEINHWISLKNKFSYGR